MAPGVELASWRGEPVPPGEAGRAAAARRSWGNRVFPASGVIGARPGAVVTGRTRSSMPPHSSCRARPGPVGAGPPGVEHDQSAGGRPLPPGSASTGWAGKDVRRDRGRGDQVPDGGRRGPPGRGSWPHRRCRTPGRRWHVGRGGRPGVRRPAHITAHVGPVAVWSLRRADPARPLRPQRLAPPRPMALFRFGSWRDWLVVALERCCCPPGAGFQAATSARVGARPVYPWLLPGAELLRLGAGPR